MQTHKLSKAPNNENKIISATEATVLVVDDNNVNLTVIKKLLNKALINVDTAKCGRDAVKDCLFQ